MKQKLLIPLLLFCVFISCKKNENTAYPSFYFRGKVDGSQIEWIAPNLPYGSNENPKFLAGMSDPGGAPFFGCNPQDSSYQFDLGTTIFEKHDGGLDFSNSISVDFARSGTLLISKEDMKSLFTNGLKSYGIFRKECSDPVLDGIVISYTDSNNKTWYSSTIDPSSNYFEQLSLTDKHGDGLYEKEWKIRFSCKLYDESGAFIYASDCEVFGPVFAY